MFLPKHCCYFLVLLAVVDTGCQYQLTKTKSSEFAIDQDSLTHTIIRLVKCQHINVGGKEITTNGHSSSELQVEIINGKKIPQDANEQDSLNKQITQQIKHALKNQNDFNTFKVLFVEEETSGSFTKTHYTGHVWESKQL